MLTEYKNERYTINIDWLQYSVLLTSAEPEFFCPDGIRIELCQGNNIFKNRAIIYDIRGAKMLTLLWTPYSSVIAQNLMTVQVANEYLYTNDGYGVKFTFELLQKIVECTFNAIGRLDICIDFEVTKKQLNMIKNMNSGAIYVQRKAEGSTFWHETNKENGYKHKQLHCMSWGSKTSEIKVKLYNKSREQGLVSGEEATKPWIVKEWEINKMNKKNVWRLEFSLNGAGQLRYKGKTITLEMVTNKNWVFETLCTLYNERFICRYNQGRREGHKNEDQRCHLLTLPIRGTALKWKEYKEHENEVPAAIELLRALMRQIDNPSVLSSESMYNYYAQTVYHHVQRQKLNGYFKRTWGKDCEELLNEIGVTAGKGIREVFTSPRKFAE